MNATSVRTAFALAASLVCCCATQAAEIPPNEQRLYQLFQSQLSFLTLLISILGVFFIIAQVYIQIINYRRDASPILYGE